MNKKYYEKQTMEVVKLEQRQQLLAGSSPLDATRNAYGDAEIWIWD